jgi:hypothetical protein
VSRCEITTILDALPSAAICVIIVPGKLLDRYELSGCCRAVYGKPMILFLDGFQSLPTSVRGYSDQQPEP